MGLPAAAAGWNGPGFGARPVHVPSTRVWQRVRVTASVSPDRAGPRGRLGLGDAVAIGAAAMLGAGVFTVFAPAARAAGDLLPLAIVVAAVVATANALSTAQLAAQHPVAGGAYAFGRAHLGPWPGFAAGWMFVVGKLASCAAIALTVGAYAWPGHERPVAALAVVAMTAVNLAGVTRTARAARVSAVVVVAVLLTAVVVGVTVPPTDGGPVAFDGADDGVGPAGVLQAAGLVFFAFAGYARIATLGGEVRDGARTIPRAIVLTLAGVLGVYVLIAVVLLRELGPARLAAGQAPLLDLVSGAPWAGPLVTAGAVVAGLGSLLVLLAGISRTAGAMARERDLPRGLGRQRPAASTPVVAELAAGAIALGLVLTTDLRGAVAFSSVGVLLYYLVANLAALTQRPPHRRFPRAVSVVGVLGCLTLVAALPASALVAALLVLAAGLAARAVTRWRAASARSR